MDKTLESKQHGMVPTKRMLRNVKTALRREKDKNLIKEHGRGGVGHRGDPTSRSVEMDRINVNPLSNKAYAIYIRSIPFDQVIDFPGWVTQYSDQFNSDWNAESIYGRQDPILTFRNTARVLTLSFDVIAEDQNTARENLRKISALAKFMYPLYEGPRRGGVNSVNAEPLIEIKWGNLVVSAKTSEPTTKTSLSSMGMGEKDDAWGGLVGACDGFTYAPVIEDGFFGGGTPQTIFRGGDIKTFQGGDENPNVSIDRASGLIRHAGDFHDPVTGERFADDLTGGVLYPKRVNISLTIRVIHNHMMGWFVEAGYGRGGESTETPPSRTGAFSRFPWRMGEQASEKFYPDLAPADFAADATDIRQQAGHKQMTGAKKE